MRWIGQWKQVNLKKYVDEHTTSKKLSMDNIKITLTLTKKASRILKKS